MLQLTPHESALLSRLVQFSQLPAEERRNLVNELTGDARLVGEVVLEPHKYAEAPEPIRATVDRFEQWLQANRRLGRRRAIRRRWPLPLGICGTGV
jgi:hypothetical protein